MEFQVSYSNRRNAVFGYRQSEHYGDRENWYASASNSDGRGKHARSDGKIDTRGKNENFRGHQYQMGWPVRHLPDMRRHSMVHSRPSRFPGDAWSPSWTPIIRAALSLSPACLTLRVYSISECGNPWSGFPADCPGRSSKGGRTVPRRKEIGHRCHWTRIGFARTKRIGSLQQWPLA